MNPLKFLSALDEKWKISKDKHWSKADELASRVRNKKLGLFISLSPTILIFVIFLCGGLALREYSNGDYIIYGSQRIGAICMDGWVSYSTGRGTCSHHGGVRQWTYEKIGFHEMDTDRFLNPVKFALFFILCFSALSLGFRAGVLACLATIKYLILTLVLLGMSFIAMFLNFFISLFHIVYKRK